MVGLVQRAVDFMQRHGFSCTLSQNELTLTITVTRVRLNGRPEGYPQMADPAAVGSTNRIGTHTVPCPVRHGVTRRSLVRILPQLPDHQKAPFWRLFLFRLRNEIGVLSALDASLNGVKPVCDYRPNPLIRFLVALPSNCRAPLSWRVYISEGGQLRINV